MLSFQVLQNLDCLSGCVENTNTEFLRRISTANIQEQDFYSFAEIKGYTEQDLRAMKRKQMLSLVGVSLYDYDPQLPAQEQPGLKKLYSTNNFAPDLRRHTHYAVFRFNMGMALVYENPNKDFHRESYKKDGFDIGNLSLTQMNPIP